MSLAAIIPFAPFAFLLAAASPPQTKPPATASTAKKGYLATPRAWEHESSDLKPDPCLRFGSFPNGLRYVWVQNDQPPKQLLLRLHVNVGSLNEKPEELGLAHFLEHMAFNGSKSFKAGTLVPTFQGQGIRFGSDVNAHTAFEETVYELALPDADPKRLDKALLWFRDVIDGLKLEPAEIDAEKGVVDAEQDARDNPGLELWFDRVRKLLEGSRYPRRIIIGDRAVRAKFDRKICAGFYDRWYRPENMTFVMVGDLGGVDPRPRLEKAFAEARGRGEPGEPPDLGLSGLTFAHSMFTQGFGGGGVRLVVARARAHEDRADDSKTRAAALVLAVACDMLETRLNDLVPRPFVTGSVGAGEEFHPASEIVQVTSFDGVSIALDTDLDHWRPALQTAEREVRRLLAEGFTDDELKAARERLEKQLAPAPATPPLTNDHFAETILRACNERFVPMDDRGAKETLRAAGKALDKAACLAAFRSGWERGKPMVLAFGALDLKDAAREMFEEAWKEAEGTSLTARLAFRDDLSEKAPKKEKPAPAGEGAAKAGEAGAAKPEEKPFAAAMPDAAAETAEKTLLPDLRAARLVFRNGVRAHLKQVEGLQGRFQVEVRVGEGMLALEPEKADVAKVAGLVFLEGGIEQLPIAPLREALEAAHASLDFDVDADACVFRGRSTATGGEAALRRLLETVRALLVAPAWSAKTLDEARPSLLLHAPDFDSPHFGNVVAAFDRLLVNGDRRLMPLDPSAAKTPFADVKAFVDSQLGGPVEVTIAGDLPVERQIVHLESTLGQLPPRRGPATIPEARRSAAPAKRGLRETRGVIDPIGRDCYLRVVYPAPDAIDAANERLLQLLGDVVGDRLRADVREKLGSSYSPDGRAWGDTALKGRGLVELQLQVEPAKLKVTTEACLASMENLARGGVKKDELERLRAARIGNPDALARDLGFWMRQLRRAHRSPALLEELEDLRRWYDGVTLAQLNALAKELLARDRASVLEISPR
jgi:zinc protease